MQLIERPPHLEVWAPAKVNLFLEVLGKRPDGYHDIATLMLAINFFDTLRIKEDPSGAVKLSCSQRQRQPKLSTGMDNLVVRAARLLLDRTGCTRGCRILLIKRLPVAAGLAGGSSDAAATLLGLNRLWQLGLQAEELEKLGAELGSDVPFFFHLPAAWCTGRGEIVQPASFPRQLDLVLLCPNFGCPTAAVYREVKVPAKPQDGAAMMAAAAAGDVEAIGRQLHNRLQPAAEAIAPKLAEYREQLAAMNPAGAILSGSGSTLFAVCRSRDEAKRIAKELRDRTAGECQVYVVRSCSEQRPP